MILSLQEAAELARVNKTTLFRAIKKGKVSASRDEHGQWRVDPAEVSRVYPIAVGGAEQQAKQQHAMPPNGDRTDELVAALREQLADIREERDRACAVAETWRSAFETERAQRLALTAPAPAKLSWWRWLRSTG
ncbi:MAG: hypothetical protein FWD12_09245 [Alphaproteobacteria bacterium]|nr:hypothetical protein [Alphaproteobacteria bacterium]